MLLCGECSITISSIVTTTFHVILSTDNWGNFKPFTVKAIFHVIEEACKIRTVAFKDWSLLSSAQVTNSKYKQNHYTVTSSFFGCCLCISNIQNTFDKKKYEIKLGLQNYAAIPTVTSCIKFNNNKINSLQKYHIAQNYRNLCKVLQHVPT
jgi:hypothetical protein